MPWYLYHRFSSNFRHCWIACFDSLAFSITMWPSHLRDLCWILCQLFRSIGVSNSHWQYFSIVPTLRSRVDQAWLRQSWFIWYTPLNIGVKIYVVGRVQYRTYMTNWDRPTSPVWDLFTPPHPRIKWPTVRLLSVGHTRLVCECHRACHHDPVCRLLSPFVQTIVTSQVMALRIFASSARSLWYRMRHHPLTIRIWGVILGHGWPGLVLTLWVTSGLDGGLWPSIFPYKHTIHIAVVTIRHRSIVDRLWVVVLSRKQYEDIVVSFTFLFTARIP